jgi:hypothetical protein
LTIFALALSVSVAASLSAPGVARAQDPEAGEVLPPPPPGVSTQSGVLDATNLLRETLHLNTIGTYSAGFVLLSYGYIGVLADALGQRVYEPDVVNSMLRETITYLSNANKQLQNYKNHADELSPSDLNFLSGISGIIVDLILEAEALADFASGEDEALNRYNDARKKAWQSIKSILKVK